MKVAVLVKATPSSEAGRMPSVELMNAMQAFNEELMAAGLLKMGEGLKPSSAGVRIGFSGDSRTVIDGPFAETKELVAGFWIWEVDSMASAIEWAKKCPNPMPEDSELEIRPLYGHEDFADIAPEVVEKEHAVRKELES